MDEADFETNPLEFSWLVKNLPMQEVSMEFEHLYPIPLNWEVTLQPTYINHSEDLEIRFSLQCSRDEDDEFIVGADTLRVRVAGETKEMDYYVFDEYNNHTLTARFRISPTATDVRVELVANFQGRICSHYGNVMQLSKDLEEMLDSGNCFDLTLYSRNPSYRRRVHRCIMRVRCPSLFEEQLQAWKKGGVVRTALSEELLKDVLSYVYTARGQFLEQLDRPEEYEHELRYAKDEFNLQRISRSIFREHVASQEVITTYHCLRHQEDFPMRNTNIANIPMVIEYDRPPAIKLDFFFAFLLRRELPSFRYRVLCWAQEAIQIRVFCEFRVDGRLIKTVRKNVKEIGPTGDIPVEWRPSGVYFYGDHPEIQELQRRSELGLALCDAEHQRSIRVVVYAWSMNQTVEIIRHVDVEKANEDLELNFLSDDIFSLLRGGDFADLDVHCGNEIHHLHRAVFAARVPEWWNVMLPVDGQDQFAEKAPIPRAMLCSIRPEAFRCILDYIYSGRLFPSRWNPTVNDEVESFALLAKMPYLASGWWDMITDPEFPR